LKTDFQVRLLKFVDLTDSGFLLAKPPLDIFIPVNYYVNQSTFFKFYVVAFKLFKVLLSNRKLTGKNRIAFDSNVHKIAIFSDELENVKQLNFS
jgi:hypothetical protein